MCNSQNELEKSIFLAIIEIQHFDKINTSYNPHFVAQLREQIKQRLVKRLAKCNVYMNRDDAFYISSSKEKSFEVFSTQLEAANKELNISVFKVEGKSIDISLVMGLACDVAFYVEKKAYQALSYAKENALPCFTYSDSAKVTALSKYAFYADMLRKIKEAFDEGKAVPVFQPIFDYEKGRVSKYECLGRILLKEDTVLSPNQFLPIIKGTHLSAILTREIFKKSLDVFRGTKYEFSVNITALDTLNQETISFIVELLKEYPNPENIVFELVEDEDFYKHKEHISNFIAIVKAFGCKISLDDFGSGYANFNVLTEFDFDFIKIDGSLISNLENRHSYDVVKTIVELAKKWNLKVVTEHVEDEGKFKMVKALNCDLAQGYYIGKPSLELLKESI